MLFQKVTQDENGICVSSELKEADKVFPLFDFFLYFVTGGGNFCLCREDCTDEGEYCASDGGVEGPAQGAVSGFVGRCVGPTVAYGLLAAPASRVEYQTQDEEQACDPLQQPADVEDAFLHDALHAHGEDGHQGHRAENEDAHGQEDSGGLPEAAGNLAEALGVGPAQRLPLHLLHARVADAAGVDAQGRVRRLGRASAPGVGLAAPAPAGPAAAAAAALGFSDEPVGAHEGNELGEGHHYTQEGPEHRATGDNNMTHIGAPGGKVGGPRAEDSSERVRKAARAAQERGAAPGRSRPRPGAPAGRRPAARARGVMLPWPGCGLTYFICRNAGKSQ